MDRLRKVPEKRSQGQTMVEFALILPVLLLVVLGLIEFGRAFFYYTMVSNAAREGTRYGIVQPKDLAGIEDAAKRRLVLIPTDTVTIAVSYQFCEGGCAPDGSNIEEGRTQVVVDVSTDFSMMTPLFQPIFPPTTIRFVSARTIVIGTRARKTGGVPTFTPGTPTPSQTPGGPIPTTPTPTPTDTPGAPPPVTDTPTPSPTPSLSPTSAPPTPTQTPGGPTATATATSSPTSPLPTSTPTAVPPTSTPTAVPPTFTPTAVPPTSTPTAVPPSATPTLSPTPGSLQIVFAAGYPCRGQEQNVNKGRVRVIVYVTDGSGNPVTDATVEVTAPETATLEHIGGGAYGFGGACWASSGQVYGDTTTVTVSASKAGWVGDTVSDTPGGNPICDGSCP